MKKIILLFSHNLSEIQAQQLQELWEVREFVSLPKELQHTWSNISPDIENLNEILKPIKEFLLHHSSNGDLVLVQGDFGAVYSLVNFSKAQELIPIYATTKRRIQEYKNAKGEQVKKSIFEHRRFREYE
jgi:hypothetical protein